MNLQITKNIQNTLDQVELAFEEGRGYDVIEVLFAAKKLVGVALANALYLGEKHWANPDESFRDYAARTYNYHPSNIKRYIDAWGAIKTAPPDLRELLIKKPIAEIIPIGTNIANESLDPDREQWKQLIHTTSPGEANHVINEITGREPKVKQNKIYIDMSTGDITSWQEGNREFIGYLDVERLDVDQVKQAVYRIINKSGIKEK